MLAANGTCGQLIHGASTFGGKLNRTAPRRSTQMLGHLLPAVLLVIIDQGADVDWGLSSNLSAVSARSPQQFAMALVFIESKHPAAEDK
jgi:hypothetical protein